MAAAAKANMTGAHQLATNIDKNKKILNQKETEQRQILSSLYEINNQIKQLSKEKSDLETEKNSLEFVVDDLREKIEEVDAQLKAKGRDLLAHIRWIKQSQNFSWLGIFSGSRGPAEADLNLFIFSQLSEREKRKAADFFVQKDLLSKTQSKLSLRLNRLKTVGDALESKEGELLSRQWQKKMALHQIKNQKQTVLRKIKNLRNTELIKKLEDSGLLDGLIQASFMEERGQLQLPIKGQLRHRFGIVKDPESSYYKNHKGIFIQTKQNAEVKSVFDGKVAFLGDIGGFGKTLILDHGDHYFSVYSSLGDVQVQEGHQVAKQQVIAQSSVSQLYKENGIYFEIRHFSEPQDPMEWIKRGSL